MEDVSTLLLVDSCADHRRRVVDMLASMGIVPHGVEFLDDLHPAARDGRPGCLVYVVDPEREGPTEVMERLGDEGWTLPAVLVVDRTTIPEVVDAMRAGAVTLIQRPVSPLELRAAVDEALELDAAARARRARIDEMGRRLIALTSDERTVVHATVGGVPSHRIAAVLGLAEPQVQSMQEMVFRKVEPNSLAELGDLALSLQTESVDVWRTALRMRQR